eukprot:9812624-Alexandrium_andersonii.AAC.1
MRRQVQDQREMRFELLRCCESWCGAILRIGGVAAKPWLPYQPRWGRGLQSTLTLKQARIDKVVAERDEAWAHLKTQEEAADATKKRLQQVVSAQKARVLFDRVRA